jgi:hypothetical protein
MSDANEPVELYRARGPDEAHALRAHLEAAGVPARVDGELLTGVVGEIPGGWVSAPRLVVPRGRLEVAEAILEEFLARGGQSGGESDGDMKCLACGAAMGEDDEQCSACGWSYYGGEPDEPPGGG